MANTSLETSRAGDMSVTLDQIVASTILGVQRAQNARPKGIVKDILKGATIGIWYDPEDDLLDVLGGQKRRQSALPNQTLTRLELRSLRSNSRPDQKAWYELSTKLSQDSSMLRRFLETLGDDFSGTVDSLFDLDEEQLAELERLSDTQVAGAQSLFQMISDLESNGIELTDVNFGFGEVQAKAAKKSKWVPSEISFSGKATTEKTGEVTVTVKWTF